MKVSVVICTLNRAGSLGATLEALRYQSWHDFEVVVVNGPSDDGTEALLAGWADRIKVARCPVPNLSVSRNIGIRAASGDVVAFLDDDALPEFDWLTQALPAFVDDVAGVGGPVFDHTGFAMQYVYAAANRFAEVDSRTDLPYDDQCLPGSFQFPYVQGTNALFLRDALLQIGGFDETYEYYLDETDVCCRLVDRGYVIRQLPNAFVHHKFLPSGMRNDEKVVTSWYPIVKNHVYFGYRHALAISSEYGVYKSSSSFLEWLIGGARWHEEAGRLPPGSGDLAADECVRALAAGIELGRARHDLRLGPVDWPAPAEFKRFPTVDNRGRRRITFVSSSYTPHLTGGIARFISDLAPALARRGHEVRVVTRSTGRGTVDLEDGVWVHRVEVPEAGAEGVAPDVLAHVNDFATAAATELDRISTWSHHDLVYGPLWDVEVLGALRRTGAPVVVQVATPLAVAADLAGNLGEPESAAAMQRLIDLELEVLRAGDLFHANSAAVAATMAAHYSGDLDPGRWGVVHLGLVDQARPDPAPPSDRTVVLFLGRFEVRKGIDTYLEAVARLAAENPDVEFVAAGEDRALAPGQPLFGASWLDAHRHEPWIERVRLEGDVSDERVHELYAGADLVVLPSRYESFGLVMVEAMMHGKALVSCATSGILDVVTDGVDGVLVTPGDVDELAAAMGRLLGDPALRRRLGEAGRARYTDAFHVDRFAERFEAFLERIRVVAPPSGTHLDEGATAVFPLDPRGAARLAVAASDAGVAVCLTDPVERVVPLDPGSVQRIDVASTFGSVSVRAVGGPVTVWGVVEVLPEGVASEAAA